MALQLYQITRDTAGVPTYTPVTGNTYPVRTVFNGDTGETQIVELAIGKEAADGPYTVVKLTPLPQSKIGNTSSADWSLKLRDGVLAPTSDEWDSIDAGNSIYIRESENDPSVKGSISDNARYTFWMQLSVPPNTKPQMNRQLSLNVTFDN